MKPFLCKGSFGSVYCNNLHNPFFKIIYTRKSYKCGRYLVFLLNQTPKQDLNSKFGMDLKRAMLLRLARKDTDLYPHNPSRREKSTTLQVRWVDYLCYGVEIIRVFSSLAFLSFLTSSSLSSRGGGWMGGLESWEAVEKQRLLEKKVMNEQEYKRQSLHVKSLSSDKYDSFFFLRIQSLFTRVWWRSLWRSSPLRSSQSLRLWRKNDDFSSLPSSMSVIQSEK